MKVQKPFSLVPILNAGTITIRGTSTMRIENFNGTNGASPDGVRGRATTREGRAREPRRGTSSGAESSCVSALMIPVFLLLDGARGRRRQLVHAQPPAPEPRRRRGVRSRRRVREELEGVRPDRRTLRPEADHGERDRRCGAAVRGRPRGGPTTRPARCRALQNTEIANQSNLDVVINSSDPNYTDDTDNTDGGVGVVADPCYSHTPATDSISPGGGQWTDVRVKERNLPSLFGGIGLPLSRARRPGARRHPAGAQRAPVPAARGAEQRDREGAGALLQRVHGRRDHAARGPTSGRSLRPTSRASSRRAAGRSGRKADVPRAGDKNLGVQPHAPCIRPVVRRLRAGRGGGPAREPRRGRPQPDVRATRRGPVRRLLPPALADPRLERRQPRLPAAADERPRDGRLRRAGRWVLQPPSLRREQLPVHASRPRSVGRPRRRQPQRHRQLPRHRERRASSIRRRAARAVSGLRTRRPSPTPRGRTPSRSASTGTTHNTSHNYDGTSARTATATPASTTAPSRRTRRSSARRQTPAPSCS